MPPLSWRCQIFLLLIYNIYWLSVPAGCSFDSLGSLTVEPPVPFLMGSDLTLYCHIDNCIQFSDVYLEIKDNQEIVSPSVLENCTAIFKLTNFREAQSCVYCKKKDPGTDYYVTGITLRSGIPPDRAQNISCETTKRSHCIDCRWNSTETHVPTNYSITIKTDNGSLTYSQVFQDEKNFSIPRELFDDNMKYQLSITTCNHFGKSHAEPLTFSLEDVVIPETPNITQIDIRNKSMSAFLRWTTSEFSGDLKPFIRRRATNGDWGKRGVSELSDGSVKVTGLQPLTDYEFQVKTCTKPVQKTDANPRTVRKRVCSKWSPSFLKKTPGKVPSLPLFVWRDSVMTSTNGQQMVTVFWKRPPADDFSGKIHWYEIFFGDGQKQKDFCASLSYCSARVRLLRPISVTVVTSYGTSPPATVPLTHSDAPGPVWEAVPPVDGSSVNVSWARPELDDKLMNYVIEWTTVAPRALHWQTVSRDQSGATITDLKPGVLYNISIFAVTTRGVSAPSSSLVYSKELEPMNGPIMSVLVHESNRALVQWDELLVEQRRGFITSYTIYYKVLDSSSPQLNVSVPVGGPREQWLDCPDGTLALQMSASNAAGEGPKGNHISSHPPAPQVGLVIVIIFIITLFIAIIVNLMCWKCARKRIKQRCIAWGPAWLGDNLPKPKNSYASKLLQLEGSEPSFFSSYIDPPLSPITLLSRYNREEPYPCVHVEPGPLPSDTTSLVPKATADCSTSSVTMGHCNYKPQTHFAEKADVKGIEEEKPSDLFEGFDRLLSIVQGDLSGSQLGPGLVYTCTDKVDTLSLMDSDASAEDALVDFSDNNEGTLAGGYFPQLFSTVGLT